MSLIAKQTVLDHGRFFDAAVLDRECGNAGAMIGNFEGIVWDSNCDARRKIK